MDGDWETVKAKPKAAKKPKAEENKPVYGGKGKKGKLIAGPIKNGSMNTNSGYGNTDYTAMNNQASAIADYEFGYDEDTHEEVKYETVSNSCAHAVSQARAKANLTQTQLAKNAGLKMSVISDIENGTARYVAGQLNSIEKALNCKIPRGRKGKK